MKYVYMTIGIMILAAATIMDHAPAKEASVPAKVTLYSDSQGRFTLDPPSAVTDYYLSLRGTCTLPSLMVQVKKKKSGAPLRQIASMMNGNNEFNFRYIFKDGPGDYEIIIFGKKTPATMNLSGLCAFTVRSGSALPGNLRDLDINDRILEYVNKVTGKTVGSGECWDLAQEALDVSGADWVRPLQFGILLNPDRDEIRPGDIIQFKSVRLEKRFDNGGKMFRTLGAPDHTAVITGVEGKKIYKLAHQNSDGKRYVVKSDVDLNTLVSGKYWIYRPVAGIVK